MHASIDSLHSSIITVHSRINRKQNNIHWIERYRERSPDKINLLKEKNYKKELLKKLSLRLNANKKELKKNDEEVDDGKYKFIFGTEKWILAKENKIGKKRIYIPVSYMMVKKKKICA